MLLKVFSTYDHQARIYSQPFFSPQTGSALRAFTQECNNPDSQFSKFPSDYELFELGTWDDNTSELVQIVPSISLGKASAFIVK
nr:MAG: nonstructural protein [Microvirus sp.]